ncbi:hypothetical protein DL96DRAFT_1124298 [Flagelloscypha sp. PMI_526]|nr:hypothetical protein DL96DRAFT_1124298 [Flagelloscypha sp. PMI_526]
MSQHRSSIKPESPLSISPTNYAIHDWLSATPRHQNRPKSPANYDVSFGSDDGYTLSSCGDLSFDSMDFLPSLPVEDDVTDEKDVVKKKYKRAENGRRFEPPTTLDSFTRLQHHPSPPSSPLAKQKESHIPLILNAARMPRTIRGLPVAPSKLASARVSREQALRTNTFDQELEMLIATALERELLAINPINEKQTEMKKLEEDCPDIPSLLSELMSSPPWVVPRPPDSPSEKQSGTKLSQPPSPGFIRQRKPIPSEFLTIEERARIRSLKTKSKPEVKGHFNGGV